MNVLILILILIFILSMVSYLLHLITTFTIFNLFIKRSKNEIKFIRGLRRNDWATEICEVMSDFNHKETCSC